MIGFLALGNWREDEDMRQLGWLTTRRFSFPVDDRGKIPANGRAQQVIAVAGSTSTDRGRVDNGQCRLVEYLSIFGVSGIASFR